MKTSLPAIAVASALVACASEAPTQQTGPASQRSEPARLIAPVVNGPIDLGTFGGVFSYTVGVNALGQVAGTSATGAYDSRTGYVRHAFVWQSQTGMIDLGTLGGSSSSASAINERGQVAGRSHLAGNGHEHAFLWQSGTGMVDLGTLGGTESYALQMNARGQVIGVSTTAGDAEKHAFFWESGTGMIDLGTLGGDESYPRAINALGQVVGWSRIAPRFGLRPFLWQSGTGMTALASLGGLFDMPQAINDAGQIVGDGRMPDIGETHLLLWQAGAMTDLGTLGGLSAAPSAINAQGQVVGTSDNGADDQWSHAFLWQSTTGWTDLGTLGGNYSAASAINAQGQVVGTSYVTGNIQMHAFLWQSGTGMIDLGIPSGHSGIGANSITDQGHIAGSSMDAMGNERAVVWTLARPLTPAEQIAALTEAVNKLVAAGKLKRGNAQSVLTKLDNANRQLNQSHATVAAQMLGEFAQRVGELVAGGILSDSDGQPLIDAARKLIGQLTT
jgi:probable HAF family extracellular repeat protein